MLRKPSAVIVESKCLGFKSMKVASIRNCFGKHQFWWGGIEASLCECLGDEAGRRFDRCAGTCRRESSNETKQPLWLEL